MASPLWAEVKKEVSSPDSPFEIFFINKKESLEIFFSHSKLEETGAWMLFFSNGLETGHDGELAGLKNVDYKIEAGRISRYSKNYDVDWNDLGLVSRHELGGGVVLYKLPRHIFLDSSGKLKWRLVLFPHDRDDPRFIPAEGPAEIDLSQFLDIQPYNHQDGLQLSWYLDQELLGADSFLKGSLNNNIIRNKKPLSSEVSLDKFSHPFPNAFWWESPKSLSQQNIIKEINKSLEFNFSYDTIVFDQLPESVDAKVKSSFLRARQRSCEQKGLRSVFYADDISDVPQGADGVIWESSINLKEQVVKLKKLRENYAGPLWIHIESKDFYRTDVEWSLLYQSMIFFKVQPLLALFETVEELNEKVVMQFLWLKLHVENHTIVDSDKLAQFPLHLYTEHNRSQNAFAQKAFVKKVYELLKDEFFASYNALRVKN